MACRSMEGNILIKKIEETTVGHTCNQSLFQAIHACSPTHNVEVITCMVCTIYDGYKRVHAVHAFYACMLLCYFRPCI